MMVIGGRPEGGQVDAEQGRQGPDPGRVTRNEAVAGAAAEGLDPQPDPEQAGGHADEHRDQVEGAGVAAFEARMQSRGPSGGSRR